MKKYSIVIAYYVEDEQIVEARNIQEAEMKIEQMIEAGLIFPGNIIDSTIDTAEILSSTEVKT
jgi:hypothetical protein